MAGAVHVVGGGIAGLAAAVRLSSRGRKVIVHEAAGHLGGRCRSFFDESLGARIDNGNHLLLSGNDAVMAYVQEIGSGATFADAVPAVFPFLDLETGAVWRVRPGKSRIPLWLLCRHMRVPGSSVGDYLAALRLRRAAPGATVAQCLDTTRPIFRAFWRPLTVAVLNTEPDEADAALLWAVLQRTFLRGEAACRPKIAKAGLSESLIDPARAYLEGKGADILLNHRLKAFAFAEHGGPGRRVGELQFTDDKVAIGADDNVVLAVPAHIAGGLLPDLRHPDRCRAIVNIHFRLPEVPENGFGGHPFIGLVGGTAEWLFVRGSMVSVTISAADALAEETADAIAARVWPEVARALGAEGSEMPASRVIKEKRATFAQVPAQAAMRPAPMTPWDNLVLAGDWTRTGLPATVEGAAVSGHRAAAIVLEDASGRRRP